MNSHYGKGVKDVADFVSRLQEIMEDTGTTVTELSIKTGIGASSISRYISGRFEPKQDKLNKIAEALDVNPAWLMGEDVPKKKIDFYYNNILPLVTKKVPMLGEIACGKPIFADEEHGIYCETNVIQADFCLRCKGDSMINARIYDGDIVFIRQQDSVDNGEIAAIITDNEATLKRVYYYSEQDLLILRAENSKYNDMIYQKRDLDSIRILGKAIAFQANII